MLSMVFFKQTITIKYNLIGNCLFYKTNLTNLTLSFKNTKVTCDHNLSLVLNIRYIIKNRCNISKV